MSFEAQHWLEKVRPPRVQITYDVEIGDAIEMKELPFVVGVMADLSGDRDPDNPLPPLRQRKFVEISRDNFNGIMEKCNPRVAMQVPNMLSGDGSLLSVLLKFSSIDDFGPVNVAQQVPAMAALYDLRCKLNDLLVRLDGNDTLDALLTNVITNPAAQKQLQSDLAPPAAPAEAADPKPQPKN